MKKLALMVLLFVAAPLIAAELEVGAKGEVRSEEPRPDCVTQV